MFESELETVLKRIFDVPKVSFAKPSDKVKEQNVLFVDVIKCTSKAKENIYKAKVTADLVMYAPATKLTFGFFNKRIQQSTVEDTKNFYFYNIEESEKVYGDVVERKLSFIYFFQTEYDPDHGSLTSVEF